MLHHTCVKRAVPPAGQWLAPSRPPPRPASSHYSRRHGGRLRIAVAQKIVTGDCYQDIVGKLASRALEAAAAAAKGSSSAGGGKGGGSSGNSGTAGKHIIGIAGPPGGGKSTLAVAVRDAINARAGAEVAVMLPMDGFHYYRRQLDAMPDPQEAHARRGAHWTFDARAFVDCVRRVRAEGQAAVPSFDHAVGDPVEGDIRVLTSHRVVLVEGNYVLLDGAPWDELRRGGLLDDTWFVDVPLDVAMERVFRRQTAIGLAPEVSRGRIAGNDRPNAELVLGSRCNARVVVPSDVPFRHRGSVGSAVTSSTD